MQFSAKTREYNLKKMRSETLDLLIIGGGITGAGIALEAGAMGIKTGLIEMQDFAAGTSSRSTKLIHGGLRYLKQFEVELVAEVSKEREIIHQNARHIVQPTKMKLPIYDEVGASFTPFSGRVALDLYDRLSKVQPNYKNYMLSRQETLENEPLLKEEHLEETGVYLDYVSDDARLTIEVLKKAHNYQALIANYVKATDFVYDDNGKITGVIVVDQLSQEGFTINANVVVNATGPWSDETRNLAESVTKKQMRPTKGVHLVVDWEKLPVQGPIYTDTGLNDNRMIFIIPRKNKTYIGTTDTDYTDDLTKPTVMSDDVKYLLKAIQFRFPNSLVTLEDIEASWAGLRPLISENSQDEKDPSAVSRGSSLTMSGDGLLTIAGGKLTDYRRIAEGVIEIVSTELEKRIGHVYPAVDTTQIRLSGGDIPKGDSFPDYVEKEADKGMQIGLSKEEAVDIVDLYGSNATIVFGMAAGMKHFPGLSLAESIRLSYALEHEMTLTPLDYFMRRTDFLLFDVTYMQTIKKPVIEAMTSYYEWSNDQTRQMTEELDKRLAESTLDYLKKN